MRALTVSVRRLVVDAALSTAAVSAVTIIPLLNTKLLEDPHNVRGVLLSIIIYTVIAACALTVTKTYRMIWRYVSFRDLQMLILAAILTVALFTSFAVLIGWAGATSLGVVASSTIMLLFANVGFLAAPRMVARALNESHLLQWHSDPVKTDAIASLITGDIGRMEAFIRECARNPKSRHRVVGVLTDDGRLTGSYLQGVQVLGRIDNLASITHGLLERGIRAEALILARDTATRRDFEALLEITAPTGLKVGRLPLHGALQDSGLVQPIELADLLGRPEVTVDVEAVASMIAGRSVIVTGAGGSIGSELTRQVAGLRPSKLVVVDFSEFNLYSIDRELSEKFPEIAREAVLLDVRDGDLVNGLIERIVPDIVFHAAALKHVPLLEGHPVEAVKTNVTGTVNVAEACHRHGVATMVTISTDKAVNPTNIMGATKRLAEAYCQGLDHAGGQSATRFVTVRFGNVLGSAGSVVPLFQRQIEAGGPVTVTHPAITRYFMTIPEAVTLVLQAGAHGIRKKDERGSIYVLEMGKPVKIIDLARQMIRLSGHRPDEDIKIKVIGLRPGEKLYEEVIHHDEQVVPTSTRSIMKLAPRTTDLRIVRQQIQELRQACANTDTERALRLLKISVPEYSGPDADSNAASV